MDYRDSSALQPHHYLSMPFQAPGPGHSKPKSVTFLALRMHQSNVWSLIISAHNPLICCQHYSYCSLHRPWPIRPVPLPRHGRVRITCRLGCLPQTLQFHWCASVSGLCPRNSDLIPHLFLSTCLHTDKLPLTCSSNATVFVPAVYACVNQTIAAQEDFSRAIIQSKKCAGGVFSSAASLQRLRFCNEISGPLVLFAINEAIDPTVFWDIKSIQGIRMPANHEHCSLSDVHHVSTQADLLSRTQADSQALTALPILSTSGCLQHHGAMALWARLCLRSSQVAHIFHVFCHTILFSWLLQLA